MGHNKNMLLSGPRPTTGSIVALITGGNSGVGLAIADRLLAIAHAGESDPLAIPRSSRPGVSIVLGCRNPSRASDARSTLLARFPDAHVHILIMDLCSPSSILSAATTAIASFPKITHLFCNAGILKTSHLSWPSIARDAFLDPIDLFTLGTNAFVQPAGCLDDADRGLVFMANTGGHYLLIRALEPCLTAGQARVIFTSSKSSLLQYYNPQDIQCRQGTHPYQSSKFALDALTLALSEKYNHYGITFHSFCPGTVYTGLIALPIPGLVILAVYHFLRLFISCMTITPFYGATAAIHLALTPLPSTKESPMKTMSRVSPSGSPRVQFISLVDSTQSRDLISLTKYGVAVADECEHIFQESIFQFAKGADH